MEHNQNVYIILLNWNNVGDTRRCIDSLRELEYPDYEILVVDNGSTDDSVSILREHCPDIILVESEVNLGFTGGNNLGMKRALKDGADLIWILNNDTVVEKDSLSLMVDKMNSDSKMALAGCTILYDAPGNPVQAYGGGRIDYLKARHSFATARGVKDEELDYITGASMLIRSEALRKTGGFDERIFIYWEDVELSVRARALGYTIGYAPGAVIRHIDNASMAEMSDRIRYYYMQGKVVFFRDQSPFWMLLIPLFTLGGVIKFLIKGEMKQAVSIIRGVRTGLKQPRRRLHYLDASLKESQKNS